MCKSIDPKPPIRRLLSLAPITRITMMNAWDAEATPSGHNRRNRQPLIPAIRRLSWSTYLAFGLLTIIGISRPNAAQLHLQTTASSYVPSTGFIPAAGPVATTVSSSATQQLPNCSNVKSILELRGVSQTVDEPANNPGKLCRFCF